MENDSRYALICYDMAEISFEYFKVFDTKEEAVAEMKRQYDAVQALSTREGDGGINTGALHPYAWAAVETSPIHEINCDWIVVSIDEKLEYKVLK